MPDWDIAGKVASVCGSSSADEVEAAYDEWAPTYEEDLSQVGIQLPGLATSMFCRHVRMESRPILEAGVGTGMVGELLRALGYQEIVGIDVSAGMLAFARSKNVYAGLYKMRLGERLNLPDDTFAATLAVGVLTPGHAPPYSLTELIRITRPKSPVIFSVRMNDGQGKPYLDFADQLEVAGYWHFVDRSLSITTLPLSDPTIRNIVLAYVKASY